MTGLSCVACIDDSSHLVKRPKQSEMSDKLWSKSFVTNFINAYKQNPCLWQQKSKAYKSTPLRNIAYDKLVAFCKPVYPEADRDFVLKKIQTLRGNFRKEYNKVVKSANTPGGKPYVPSLWYYNLMLFIVQDGANSPAGKIVKRVPNNVALMIKQEQQGSSEDYEDEDSEEDFGALDEMRYMDSNSKQQEPHSTDQSRAFSTPSNTNDRKRKSSCLESTYDGVMSECPCKRHDVDEFEATGISVTKKLRRMDAFQAICAEFLINSILKRGLLKTLLPSTTLCDSQCNSMR